MDIRESKIEEELQDYKRGNMREHGQIKKSSFMVVREQSSHHIACIVTMEGTSACNRDNDLERRFWYDWAKFLPPKFC
jgi:hypothetical protein